MSGFQWRYRFIKICFLKLLSTFFDFPSPKRITKKNVEAHAKRRFVLFYINKDTTCGNRLKTAFFFFFFFSSFLWSKTLNILKSNFEPIYYGIGAVVHTSVVHQAVFNSRIENRKCQICGLWFIIILIFQSLTFSLQFLSLTRFWSDISNCFTNGLT